MNEYTVLLTGVYAGDRFRKNVFAKVATKAGSSRMAILQVSGIDPKTLAWGPTPWGVKIYDDKVVDVIQYKIEG